MYKNQLQELAQRSCFNLPSYTCIREGPDHAPRFKAAVNFNGEIFESPTFCSTLRQAEHAAAEVALNVLSKKAPSRALAARVLDETGVYKNLLQETAHRAGLKLPVYITVRSGPGHVPVFSCTVELAQMSFTGEPAKTKKQAQKNAALTAWSALKKLAKSAFSSPFSSYPVSESGTNDEQEQVIVARYLATLRPPEINSSQRRERRTVGSSASIWGDVIPYDDTKSFYSLHNQNWGCSQFYPELYQTFPQERVSQRHEHLLAISSLPSSAPRPPFFPFIQSMFQPDVGHYFPPHGQEPVSLVPEVGPFLYFSNRLMHFPVRSVSQVTIQEIEENPQMEGWLKGDGDPNCWKNNCPSNVSSLSPTEIPNSLVSLNSHSEKRMQERIQEEEDEEKSGSSVPKAGNSRQLQCNQLEQCDWISPGFINASYRPRAINTDGTKFHLQNQDRLDHLQSNIRPSNPPMISSSGSVRSFQPASSLAPPVTIRASTTAFTGSLRHKCSNPPLGAPPPTRIAANACSSRHFMAPAVHIRSVVPVCSAPPTKREGVLSGVEKKRPEEARENISSSTSSDFSKHRI